MAQRPTVARSTIQSSGAWPSSSEPPSSVGVGADAHAVERRRGTAGSWLNVSWRSTVTPAASGRTRNRRDVARRRSRAGTMHGGRRGAPRARRSWRPSSRQPSPSGAAPGVTGSRGPAPSSSSAAVRTVSPLDDAGQPAPAAGRRCRTRRSAARRARWSTSSGTGATVRPICSSSEAGLEEAEAAAADRLGQGDAEQVGLGQLGPQVAVEPVGAGLDLARAARARTGRSGSGRPGRRSPAARR